jgi:hypothetical protein
MGRRVYLTDSLTDRRLARGVAARGWTLTWMELERDQNVLCVAFPRRGVRASGGACMWRA